MTLRQPPPIAGQLLKRLVPGQDHDTLLGDLNEELQRGRSLVWYWAQIIAAIVVGSWRDLRAHPIVAARAVVTGLIARALLVVTIATIVNVLTGARFQFLWRTAWLGPSLYWPYISSLQMILVFASVGDIAVGWLIVRLHRGHGLTLLLLCYGVFAALGSAGLLRVAFLRGLGASQLYRLMSAQIRLSLLMLLGGYLAIRGETARPGDKTVH